MWCILTLNMPWSSRVDLGGKKNEGIRVESVGEIIIETENITSKDFKSGHKQINENLLN